MIDLMEHAKKRVKNNKAHQYVVSADEYEGLVEINEYKQRWIAELENKVLELSAKKAELIRSNGELSAAVERLRDIRKGFGLAINDARVLIALIEAIDATPQQNLDSLKREVAGEAFLKGAEWMAQCELDDTLHLDENQAAFEYAEYSIGKE